MKQPIASMFRASFQYWTVHLACGHKMTISTGLLKRLQWFIGRPVECAECAKGETK